jgi:DNA-binding transcriptional regulator YiaG
MRARSLAASGEGRRIRLEANVSLREMAPDVKAHWSTIARWETGETRPRGEAARRWVALLDELRKAGAA